MKRTVLLLFAAGIPLLASACGTPRPAPTPPAPSLPSVPSRPTASAASAQPASTATTASSSAQLPASSAGGTPVTVTLAANKIASSLTSFKVGVPYTFVITNAGPGEACFDIAEPESVTGSLGASTARALASVGKTDLQVEHETVLKYAFPEAAAGMRLEFSCLMRRHYDDGMRLTITVTQ